MAITSPLSRTATLTSPSSLYSKVAHSPSPQQGFHSNPCLHFSKCSQNDVTMMCHKPEQLPEKIRMFTKRVENFIEKLKYLVVFSYGESDCDGHFLDGN